ncbi:ParA family protein [Candidatus Spongiihabitans sp.]|uniref:ParA family protein n=1 Tax=Candidatus Spongiihabitans sp. TaxID=3101308 RepID=UPI003C7E962A
MSEQNPICVSVINMKGGVGKTTIAAHLCHEAYKRKMNVLAVDLDPQANLSQSLMGGVDYKKFLDNNDPSIVDLFKGFHPPDSEHGTPREIHKNDVLKKVRPFFHKDILFDLIPSRFDFSKFLIKSIGSNEFILAEFISKNGGDYDVIFIDCAPTESLLTRTAYHASRYVLVPVKPEFLATIGFPLLRVSLNKFKSANKTHRIDVCGVVINNQAEYVDNNEKLESREQIMSDAGKNEWSVYNTELSYSRGYPKSLRQGRSLANTHCPGTKAVVEFPKFAKDFFGSIGL